MGRDSSRRDPRTGSERFPKEAATLAVKSEIATPRAREFCIPPCANDRFISVARALFLSRRAAEARISLEPSPPK